MAVRVQAEDFDIGAELAALTAGRNDVGGVGCFVGLVRGDSKGVPVQAMTLEHYPGMTERQMAAVEAEARNRWPLQEVLIIHRIGRLLPGAQIVLVLTCSAHRAAALESCAFLIDWLKTKAPFWKYEETGAGGAWVAARAEDDQAASRWTA